MELVMKILRTKLKQEQNQGLYASATAESLSSLPYRLSSNGDRQPLSNKDLYLKSLAGKQIPRD